MQAILNWITANLTLVIIIGAVLLLLIVLLVVLTNKKKKATAKTTCNCGESCNCTTTEKEPCTCEKETCTCETAEATTATETATDDEVEESEETQNIDENVNVDDIEVVEVDDDNEEEPVKKEVVNIYHVTLRKSDGKWQVKKQNSTKAIKLFDTQLEAIKLAKVLAKNSEGTVRVHKVTGQMRKFS